MLDFNINITQLALIWAFAGLVCIIPLFHFGRTHKFVIVPIVFVAIFISVVTTVDYLGKPFYGKPEGKFLYIYHVAEEVRGKKYITLWAYAGKKDRLFRFPHTDERERELKKAKQQSRNGVPQQGEFRRLKKKERPDETRGDLKTYPYPYQELMKK